VRPPFPLALSAILLYDIRASSLASLANVSDLRQTRSDYQGLGGILGSMRGLVIVIGAVLALVAPGCGGGGQRLVDAAIFAEATDTFGPRDVLVDPDAQIAWTNVDSEPHSITPDVAGDGPDSAAAFPNGIGPGQTFYWRVPAAAAPGTRYFYHCRFHGQAGNGQNFGNGMVGVVRVR